MTPTKLRTTQTNGREVLLANRTYYVRTDGNNSNTGLVNSAGGAFLTIQKAIDVASGLDLSIYDVIIQVADGTYAAGNVCKTAVGAGGIIIQGNAATPANVVISVGASGACFLSSGVKTIYSIKDLKMSGSSSYAAVDADAGSILQFFNVDFGAGFTYHIESIFGATVVCGSSYKISGGAGAHFTARAGGGVKIQSVTVTLTGTPAFSSYYANARYGSVVFANGCTFSGAADGQRYNADLNGIIQTAGGGADYFPGNAAGATATGAQYA